MTSLLLDPRQLTSGDRTRAAEIVGLPDQLDQRTETIELDPSTLLAIAGELADSAQRWPGMGKPNHRVWDLMVAYPDFEAWVIGWPPGGAIELHDHGESSGAVVVARGELLEVVVTQNAQGALATTNRVLLAPASVTFDTAHIHEIVNPGPGPAISVHVYAPRLTAMTYYEFSNGLLEARATVRSELGTAIP
jgi:Cysteine dioxygenase type I